MAANTQPIFFKSPILWQTTLTNEVVGRQPGSSVPKLLGTAGSEGTLIETIQIFPLGNVSNNQLRLFRLIGSTYTLLLETPLPSVSPSDTGAVTGYPVEVTLPKTVSPATCDAATPHRTLKLPAGEVLYCALSTASSAPIMVMALGGNY